MQNSKPVCVAWFRREDYPRIRAISADRDNLPESFDEWQGRFERQLAPFVADGVVPVKIIIDPDALVAFAAGREINSKRRAEFATVQIAADLDKTRH